MEPDPDLLGRIYDLQQSVGDILLDFNNFNRIFTEALEQAHFQNAQLIAKRIRHSIEMLRTITNSTEIMLQTPQIAKYRTMTAAVRIIHNTCSSVDDELEVVLPIVEGENLATDDLKQKIVTIREQIGTSHGLLKRYLNMLIVHA